MLMLMPMQMLAGFDAGGLVEACQVLESPRGEEAAAVAKRIHVKNAWAFAQGNSR